MKKRILLPIAALLCLTLLAGCKFLTRTDFDFDTDSISKAQKIVVHDAAGNEKAVLSEEADLDAFVETVNVGGWKFIKEVPEGLTEAGSFALWQQETVTALIGESEAKENEICTFRCYQEGDYLTIDTGVMDISFTFAIPQGAADYLRTLVQ